MQNVRTLLKTWGPAVALITLFVAFPTLAQDQGGRLSGHLDGHATEEVSAVFRAFLLFMMLIGVVVLGVSLWGAYCLVNEKGPQQIQQIGWKGPGAGFIIGGLLTSLPWWVGTGSQTATGGGMDTDTWQRLQGQAPIIAPAPARLAAIDLVVADTEAA